MEDTSGSILKDLLTPHTDLQYSHVHCPRARFAGCSYQTYIRFAGFTVYYLHQVSVSSDTVPINHSTSLSIIGTYGSIITGLLVLFNLCLELWSGCVRCFYVLGSIEQCSDYTDANLGSCPLLEVRDNHIYIYTVFTKKTRIFRKLFGF